MGDSIFATTSSLPRVVVAPSRDLNVRVQQAWQALVRIRISYRSNLFSPAIEQLRAGEQFPYRIQPRALAIIHSLEPCLQSIQGVIELTSSNRRHEDKVVNYGFSVLGYERIENLQCFRVVRPGGDAFWHLPMLGCPAFGRKEDRAYRWESLTRQAEPDPQSARSPPCKSASHE